MVGAMCPGIEPQCKIDGGQFQQIDRYSPFFVLIVPPGHPSLRHLRRRRPRGSFKVGHNKITTRAQNIVTLSKGVNLFDS